METVVVIDCGVGNVMSVVNACLNITQKIDVVSKASDLENSNASRIIFPGVGAAGRCLQLLREKSLDSAITKKAAEQKIPFLGICVGMQVLASKCEEFGDHHGLNLIPGKVKSIDRLSP
jgi:imidazole glycerol-phosphate synthase subunit HisH